MATHRQRLGDRMNHDPFYTSDRDFEFFLNRVDLDTVRLEQTAHFSPDEWHVLARDRRTR